MRPLPRPQPRWKLRFRRPAPATVLTVTAAVATFVFVQAIARDADDAGPVGTDRDRVLVAAEELDAGHVIGSDDVRTIEVPQGLVPAAAVTSDPVGRTVRNRVGEGELLVDHRLSGPGVPGIAALLGPDQRGVAVPHSGVDLALIVGDQVDVLATLGPSAETGDPTVLLIERATVIATDDETVTLAVERTQATALTYALVTATVTLTLVA